MSLNDTFIELEEGASHRLNAIISPEDAENQKVVWNSDNPSVVSVSEGLITAIKVGSATVTVTTEDGGKTATCDVTVVAKIYPVESVSLDKTSVELTEGDSTTLTATVTPDNATNRSVTWTSSDESVATVTEGKVTAVKAGSATVTVTTEDGGKTAICDVTVVAKIYSVESVSLDKTSVELIEGEVISLTATVTPDNATNRSVTWTSSDESVATVTEGKVTAVKAGSANIIVTTVDGGKVAICDVTVVSKVCPVESVSLDKTSVELIEGEVISLTATVTPDNATNRSVTWTSSDESVATVTEGKVTAVKAGSANIIVTTVDGGKVAICDVTVVSKVCPVESVSLDKTSVELTEGEVISLTATVTPDNATNRSVTWTSSDESVATVTEGKVTAVKAGSANIIVTTVDGGKVAICDVTVVSKVYPVESVSLDKTSVELIEGEVISLTATVTPDNATNRSVTWTSSDESVATVTEGKVTAVKAGTAVVTVTTEDGGKTANCEVKVIDTVAVNGVVLDRDLVELVEGYSITLNATVNPDNATNKDIAWITSDAFIATVSEGRVTAVKAGTATITAITLDGGKTANCKVRVLEPTPVSQAYLDKTYVELNPGETITIIANILPADATIVNVVWESSDASVATVNNGTITAVNGGFSTITATIVPKTGESILLDCTVKVLNPGGNEGIGYDNYN